MTHPCSEHVLQLPLSSPTLIPATTTNTYLIVNQGECLLVDPGYDSAENTDTIFSVLQELGNPKLKGVIFTHYHKDHTPGIRGIAKRLECDVYCHTLEKEAVETVIQPVRVSRTVENGAKLHVGQLDVIVYHTPGHTPGHIALFVESDRVLITGDTVINQGSTWIGPPDGHLRTYLQSLEFLKTIPAKTIAPGHGSVIHTPREAIDWFIARRLERESQILEILKHRGNASVQELVDTIYAGQVHPSILWVAEKTVLGHLIKLEEDGHIQEASDMYVQKQETDTPRVPDAKRTFRISRRTP
jgi:ribonuclease/clavin/mitogillin